jgi:hypothetical protein
MSGCDFLYKFVGLAVGDFDGGSSRMILWGGVANQSQFGLAFFAETLELVQGAVVSALQSGFVAADQG